MGKRITVHFTKTAKALTVFALLISSGAMAYTPVTLTSRDNFSPNVRRLVLQNYQLAIAKDAGQGPYAIVYRDKDLEGEAQAIVANLIQASHLESLYRLPNALKLDVFCLYPVYPSSIQMDYGVLRLNALIMSTFSTFDQKVFIFAHELSHLILAHSERGLQFIESQGWFSQIPNDQVFTDQWIKSHAAFATEERKFELEADALGLVLLKNAGFDPRAGAQALKLLSKEGTDEDAFHPNFNVRTKRLRSIEATIH